MTSVIIVTALFLGFSFSLSWTLGYKEKAELSEKLTEIKDTEKKFHTDLEKAKSEAEKSKNALKETEKKLAEEEEERKKAEEARIFAENRLQLTEEEKKKLEDEIQSTTEKLRAKILTAEEGKKKAELEKRLAILEKTQAEAEKNKQALIETEKKLALEAEERKKAEEARIIAESRLQATEEEKKKIEKEMLSKVKIDEIKAKSLAVVEERKRVDLEQRITAEIEARKQAEQKWLLAETKRSIAEKEAIERIKMEERLKVSAETGEEIERLRIALAEAKEEARLAAEEELLKIDRKSVDVGLIEKEKIVATAREELTKIAETIDVLAHSGERDMDALKPALKQLGQISENFEMMGLDKARDLAMREHRILSGMIEGAAPVDDKALKNVAGMMRNIEFVTGAYSSTNSRLLHESVDNAKFVIPVFDEKSKIKTGSEVGAYASANSSLLQQDINYTERASPALSEKVIIYREPSLPGGQKEKISHGDNTGDVWWTEEVIKYKVVKGNTLSLIAAQDYIYDDWRLWTEIYKHNMHIIKDPNIIYPGQILIIPKIFKDIKDIKDKSGHTDYIVQGLNKR